MISILIKVISLSKVVSSGGQKEKEMPCLLYYRLPNHWSTIDLFYLTIPDERIPLWRDDGQVTATVAVVIDQGCTQ